MSKNTICLWYDKDQTETDRYWNAIVENGGEEARRTFDAMMDMQRIDVARIAAVRRG